LNKRGETIKYLYLFLAIAIIAAISVFSLDYWQDQYPLFIGSYDIAYHANSVVGLERCGGFTMTNFWAGYSPEGSRNIYLPFFHLAGLVIMSLGAGTSFLTYWMSWSFFPLSLIAVLLFAYRAYGARIALYSVMLLALSPVWMEKQWGMPPQALVYVLTPLVFWALVEKRFVAATILTLCTMATHFTGLFLLPFLFLYGAQSREQRRPVFIMLAVILLLGSPFIVFMLQRIRTTELPLGFSSHAFRGALRHMFDLKDTFHVYLGWLAVIGLAVCYFKRKRFLILPCYLLAGFPLACSNWGMRFWVAPAFFIFALLGGVALGGLHRVVERMRFGKLAGLAYFVLIFLLAHALFYGLSEEPEFIRTPLLLFLNKPDIWQHPTPIFPQEDRDRMVELVGERVGEKELFWVEYSNNMNNYVALRSNRSTIASITLKENAMTLVDGIKLVVAKAAPSSDYIILDRINEQYNAYILADGAKAAKITVPKPLLTVRQIQWIFMALGALILIDLLIPRRGNSRRPI